MRWLFDLAGVVLALLGTLSILRGINLVRVGFMAGHLQYTLLGLLAGVAGLALIGFAGRRRKNVPSSNPRG